MHILSPCGTISLSSSTTAFSTLTDDGIDDGSTIKERVYRPILSKISEYLLTMVGRCCEVIPVLIEVLAEIVLGLVTLDFWSLSPATSIVLAFWASVFFASAALLSWRLTREPPSVGFTLRSSFGVDEVDSRRVFGPERSPDPSRS